MCEPCLQVPCLSCVRVPMLTFGKTMHCMLWRLMLLHKVYIYLKVQEENVATWYVWRNDETNKLCKVLGDWTTNNLKAIEAIYQFHSAPVPPTWLHKKRESSSIPTRMESCSERHSRYITSSHPSRYFRNAYLCCPGQNSRCTLGATLG